jgi:c-di-GMP-binding flagellar brake protein YcgR
MMNFRYSGGGINAPISNQARRDGWEPAGSPVERRASLRFQWKGTASIRILPDGPNVLGVLLDLSEGGCGIELGMAIPAQVGAKVKVDLRVQGLTLTRMGILRNIQLIRSVEKETRAGIEFIEGRDRDAEQYRLLTKGLLTQTREDA